MTTINVKDAAGSTVAVARVADTGTAADTASLPVALSTEGKAQLGALTETAPASDTASSGLNGRLQRVAQRLTSLIALLPASLGIKTGAASLSIVPASDATFAVLSAPTSTGTQSSVASSASDATILASNADRRGASIYNDDANVLYVLLASGTSSATAYSAQIQPSGYYEVPFGYTGVIKGIWGADGAGSARVTEFTA